MISTLFGIVRRFFRSPVISDLAMVSIIWAIFLAAALTALLLVSRTALALPLSEADRVSVSVFDGADFSGKYQVNINGAIEMPYVGPIVVAGMEPAQAAKVIAETLVEKRFFQRDILRVSVQVLDLAPVEVNVEGAVFYPGRLRVNLPPSRDRAPEKSEELPGARMSERYLSDALRAAGGIRPTADHRNIRLIRGEVTNRFDITGLLEGSAVDDIPLIAGDRIVVPDTGNINAFLMRPSRVTPPGIKVYFSNTTAGTNTPIAGSVGTISMPYGSRLSQVIAAGNCSGGTFLTTALRRVTFSRTDRVTGETRSLAVDTEELLTKANDRNNPFLMEGDTISCYESAVANVRDVFRAITDVLLPFRSLGTSVAR